jgi:hypothetical protein
VSRPSTTPTAVMTASTRRSGSTNFPSPSARATSCSAKRYGAQTGRIPHMAASSAAMKRRRDNSRRIGLVAVVAAVAVAGATTVNAATAQVVSLRLVGSTVKRTVACPGEHHPDTRSYTLFHRNARITITGSVTPKPSARPWRIRIEIKRCARGQHFHRVWFPTVTGRTDGSFMIVYTVRLPGFYVARGEYGKPRTVLSSKHFFVVR